MSAALPLSPCAPGAARELGEVLRHARRSAGLPPAGQRALIVGVLAAHGALAWGLWQLDGVRQAVQAALPLQGHWIAPPAPTPEPPPPPAPATPRPPQRSTPVIAAAPTPAPAPQAAATLAPEPVAAEPAPPAQPAPAAVAAVAAPLPPAAPVVLPSTALRYLVPPAQVYPLASRRLREQGTVLLRLVVDAQGLPQQVSLHRSSGFARLDEQALQAMRAARFAPHTVNGSAVAWTALAPLAYELD